MQSHIKTAHAHGVSVALAHAGYSSLSQVYKEAGDLGLIGEKVADLRSALGAGMGSYLERSILPDFINTLPEHSPARHVAHFAKYLAPSAGAAILAREGDRARAAEGALMGRFIGNLAGRGAAASMDRPKDVQDSMARAGEVAGAMYGAW